MKCYRLAAIHAQVTMNYLRIATLAQPTVKSFIYQSAHYQYPSY